MTNPNAENTLPLSVDKVGFLLDRLGEDCHPLQFLRELTQNSIEAILRTPKKNGQIIWDVDWTAYELGDPKVYKLCITDTGSGMTGEEMVRYINQLSSSSSIQSSDGNYGVGAKIAAATRNHAGLVYLSWKEGKGTMIHLWRDPISGQYGLRQMLRPDGSFGHWGEIDEDVKPEVVGEHGTKIILYGNSLDQDTMKAPPEAGAPTTWIAKFLNTRYFRFPEGVTIKARQGWEQQRSNTNVNVLRTVSGQESYLEAHKESSGSVELRGVTAHWWILKNEKALGSNSGYIESSGHIAALYRDELYELAGGRSGSAKLQNFGVIFGQKQVVIYLEPNSDGGRLATNTARTDLLVNSLPLPWSEWASEFRSKLPAEIVEHIQKIASKSREDDHGKSIRERLKNVMDLFKVSRYKPKSAGMLEIGEATPHAGGRSGLGDGARSGKGSSGRETSGGAVGGVYSTFLKKGGKPGDSARPDLFPTVEWISVEQGTREPGDIEDKAARYIEDQNLLLVNADFRAFRDMVDHWVTLYSKEHGMIAGIPELVRGSVHGWFEQALVETILGLQALRGSLEWSTKDLQEAWSEVALTAVVMQRYHPYNSIKREMGTKIASLKK